MRFKYATHILLTLLLLLAVFGVYALWYRYVEKESITAATLEGQIETQAQDSQRAQQAKDELAQITNDQTTLTNYFVQTSDIVPFLESLQKIGQQRGATVNVVSVAAETAKPHNYLNLSLQITGPFDSVLRTLGAIEYEPYDTAISNLTLDTSGSGQSTAAQWTASVVFHVGTIDAPVKAVTPARAIVTPATVSSTTTASTTPVTVPQAPVQATTTTPVATTTHAQ